MNGATSLVNTRPCALAPRNILYVDPDESYATMLHHVWLQLRFADHLHIVRSPAEALEFLSSDDGRNAQTPLAAVVLDPDATGEETGQFLRGVRNHGEKDAVPIVFWSRDGDKYRVLEGNGVASVLKKPMVLRLIQSLDAACTLRVQHFPPFAGNSAFEYTKPQTKVGART